MQIEQRSNQGREYHEKNISTPQYAQKKDSRFQSQDEDQKRQKNHKCQKSQRQKKISRLSSYDRIKSSDDFTRIYKNAQRIWHTSSFVMFHISGDKREVAFVAGKKVGNAVKRNRAKRILRALFLKYIDRIQTGSYIFVAKPRLLSIEFREAERVFADTMKKSDLLF